MGLASIWAAVLDDWVETDIAVADIPTWIASRRGIRDVYDGGNGSKTRRDQNDIVYTADALAARIVAHLPIGPTDFCVDPCRGRGAFYKALPEGRRDWCELKEGRDFRTYEFGRRVHWVVTNPPFSDAYLDIAARSFMISDNVVFLVKLPLAISTYARHRAWRSAGHGLREIIYIRWEDAGFLTQDGTEKVAEGFILAVLWWQRHWTGGIWETDWTEGEEQKPRSFAVAEAAVYEKFGIEETNAAKFDDLIDGNTTTFEYTKYTLKYILDALGCMFDFDPAGPGRNIVPWFPVEYIYRSGGLEHEWQGFAWLNLLDGGQILPDWINKFVEHGNGIALVPARTSTRWWQELAAQADLILFLNRKTSFANQVGENNGAYATGTILVAMGAQAVVGLTAASRKGLGVTAIPVADQGKGLSLTTIAEAPE